MIPVLLVEPDTRNKRQRFSKTVLGTKKVIPHPTVQDIKEQLREIRNYSLAHQDILVNELMTSLSAHPDVEFSFAEDTEQAVKTIQEISDGIPIAINKSSVVTKELMPALVASGLRVIETYYDQFQSFENRFVSPWQLPTLESTTFLDSFSDTTDLSALREASVRRHGSKQIVGLLGVSAISAKDGTVLLLQHMHNISDVFTQTNRLILVASLDKVVENLEAAVFQTRCMALFGWGALPLSIHSRTTKDDTIDHLPFELPTEQTAQKVHVIVFDNGRNRLLRSRYEDLIACINCSACIRSCPAFPFNEVGSPWSPKEYVYFFITGKNPSLELCLECGSCQADCPLDIDLPGMILDARIEAMVDSRRPLTDSLLSNFGTISKWGSSVPFLANVASSNKIMRWLGEKTLDISKERQLPKFQRMTFTKWFQSSLDKNMDGV
jgi:L-lactate dehydrogenase complex protein LldF